MHGNRLVDYAHPLEGVLHGAWSMEQGAGSRGVGKIEVGASRAGGAELRAASSVVEAPLRGGAERSANCQ